MGRRGIDDTIFFFKSKGARRGIHLSIRGQRQLFLGNGSRVFGSGRDFLIGFWVWGHLPLSRAFAVLWVAGGEKQPDGTTQDYAFITHLEKSKHVRRLIQ